MLLVSSLGVEYSAEATARLSATAEAEHLLWDSAAVSIGNVAFHLLAVAQGTLSSRPWGCNDAVGEASRWLAGLEGSLREASLTVYETLSLAAPATYTDNLSIMAPFDGSPRGSLSFLLQVNASGSSNSSAVSFARHDEHLLSLPVHLAAAAAICLDSEGSISSTLNSSAVTNCTRDAILSSVEAASSEPQANAASAGMALDVAFAQVAKNSCSIDFTVLVSQHGIEGPGGPFTVTVESAGSATLAVSEHRPGA
jgi:hypothetical protein